MGDILITPRLEVRSKLRLIAGSDDVVVHFADPAPNRFARWLVRQLLRMEWIVCE